MVSVGSFHYLSDLQRQGGRDRDPIINKVENILRQHAQRGVVTIDYDGTMTGSGSMGVEFPDQLKDSICRARVAGYLVALNSTRPLEYLQMLSNNFNMSPIIFAEGGNLAYFSDIELKLLLLPGTYRQVQGFRSQFSEGINQLGLGEEDLFRFFEQSVPFNHYEEWPKLRDQIGYSSNGKVILLQGTEVGKVGLWCFRNFNGKAVYDEELFELTREYCERIINENGWTGYEFGRNKSGTFMSFNFGGSKSVPWEIMKELLGDQNGCHYHIGNDGTDCITTKGVKNSCVANATQELLRRADRISQYPSSRGVVELLNQIIDVS